jgi:hypothetical protein
MQDKKAIHTSQDMQLELGHHAELSGKATLDTKLTARKIDYVRDKVVAVGTNHGSDFVDDPLDPADVFIEPVHNRTELFPEKGAGLEFILNWQINEKNKLLAGASAGIVKAGPGEYRRFNVNTGQPPADPGVAAQTVLYNETTDKTYGVPRQTAPLCSVHAPGPQKTGPKKSSFSA